MDAKTKDSLTNIAIWLKSYADQEVSKAFQGYEEGMRDGKTLMARGVLDALKMLRMGQESD